MSSNLSKKGAKQNSNSKNASGIQLENLANHYKTLSQLENKLKGHQDPLSSLKQFLLQVSDQAQKYFLGVNKLIDQISKKNMGFLNQLQIPELLYVLGNISN